MVISKRLAQVAMVVLLMLQVGAQECPFELQMDRRVAGGNAIDVELTNDLEECQNICCFEEKCEEISFFVLSAVCTLYAEIAGYEPDMGSVTGTRLPSPTPAATSINTPDPMSHMVYRNRADDIMFFVYLGIHFVVSVYMIYKSHKDKTYSIPLLPAYAWIAWVIGYLASIDNGVDYIDVISFFGTMASLVIQFQMSYYWVQEFSLRCRRSLGIIWVLLMFVFTFGLVYSISEAAEFFIGGSIFVMLLIETFTAIFFIQMYYQRGSREGQSLWIGGAKLVSAIFFTLFANLFYKVEVFNGSFAGYVILEVFSIGFYLLYCILLIFKTFDGHKMKVQSIALEMPVNMQLSEESPLELVRP